MSRYKIHILYEYGADLRPHGSAFIRLLRPLTHPTLQPHFEITHGLDYEGQQVDAVIVDRFWHQNVTFALAADLIENIRRAGAKIIYTLDDNLLELSAESGTWLTKEHVHVIELFLRQADGVIVTTQPLQEQLAGFNSNIIVIPNVLDERLLTGRKLWPGESPFGPRRTVIGYMGTLTHDDDLIMVLPALKTAWQRHPEQLEFQIVGAFGRKETLQEFQSLPLRVVRPRPDEIEYPLFMLWFLSRIRWDIALAPLQNTLFNRCKSDIKFLDYCAIGATGIYSRVPAYETNVRHHETGWLVENEIEAWVDALEELLANASCRKRVAQNGLEYLYRERILAHCPHHWLEVLENRLGNS